MSLLPAPSPLLGSTEPAVQVLRPLDVAASPGLANALLLLGHPFITRLDTAATAAARGRPLTLQRLRQELIGRRRARSTCVANAHELVNGSVRYRELGSSAVSCAGLLRSLSSPASSVYAVIDLEATRATEDACPRLGRLGAAVGALHELVRTVTGGQGAAAHAKLRAGTAADNASTYGLHYDGAENFLLQLAGSKQLSLAPPSQAASAAIEVPSERRQPDEGERRSRIDFRQSSDAIISAHPQARRLMALRVTLQEGDAVFIPRGWLHHIHANRAPTVAAARAASVVNLPLRRGPPPPRARPWLSINLFFTHRIAPTFRLFDSCAPARVSHERARMPRPHALALERLGLERAREAYCQFYGEFLLQRGRWTL
jgi:hypothetical protein